LVVHRVDFSYESVNGESIKTTFQCVGCLEFYYTLENTHVANPDNTPEYKCPYCQNQCSYLSLQDDWSDYWKCVPCKTSFTQTYNPNHSVIEIVNMYTVINNKIYVLRQFLYENRSRVDLLPADEEDTIVIAHEFNFLFPNVTPTNIQQKLLTYLVFS
jgi:hypothetical protein